MPRKKPARAQNVSEWQPEFPLRGKHDVRHLLLSLVFLPALLVSILSLFFAYLLFDQPLFRFHEPVWIFPPPLLHWLQTSLGLAGFHFAALIFFLVLLWTPVILATINLPNWLETSLVMLRTAELIAMAGLCFPHALAREFLNINNSHPLMPALYWGVFALITTGYWWLSYINNSRKAFGDVRRATTPESRSRSDRWISFEAFSIFLILFAVMAIEGYFLATHSAGKITLWPYDLFTTQAKNAAVEKEIASLKNRMASRSAPQSESVQIDPSPFKAAAADSIKMIEKNVSLQHRMTKLAWICGSMLCGLLFFMFSCLPDRLMRATLIPVTFHERDMAGVIGKAHRYLLHFGRAMLLKSPLLLLGGLIITFTFLITPALLTSASRLHFLEALTQADEIILVLAVFLAWFIPLSLAVVTPDETFGEYFNARLANHIMMIQGHLIFI